MGAPNKRKLFLINKSFQLSILGWFVSLSISTLAIIYFANLYFFNIFSQEAIAAGIPSDHNFFIFLSKQKETMNYLFLIISVITFGILSIGGLILSHKVAGPIYRLTEYLKSNSPGSAIPLKFRNSDYFHEVEVAFNAYINRKSQP